MGLREAYKTQTVFLEFFMLTPIDISNYVMAHFYGLKIVPSWGETSFFYNPDGLRPRGTYFCTIKEHDGQNDSASQLNSEGAFRFNFGISKKSFEGLFAEIPQRPAKGCIIKGDYDFTQLNVLQPHPIYGWMCWVAIVNPSKEIFEQLQPLLIESYQRARGQ